MKLLLVLLLFAVPAAAQDTWVIGTSFTLAWDQQAASLAQAQSYSYKLYVAGAADYVLTGVTCTGIPSVFMCQAQLTALPVGTYGFELTASANGLESARSSPVYTITVVAAPVQPTPPKGLRRGQQ